MSLQIIFSYLDPGTGSIIVQSIIGFVAGIALFGRHLFGNTVTKARKLFSRSKKK